VPATSGSGDEEADTNQNNAVAYNQSIYLMVGMPYLLLGGLTFLIYRGLKKNQEFYRAQGRPDPQGPPDA
jgi:hypothetical protein